MTIKLPRLTPEQAWVLNQHVMCDIEHGTPEQIEEAKRLNDQFIHLYWEVESIDLYLAISMRTLEDIQRAERVCDFFEGNGYTVYNPGNNCESSRYTKSDLERGQHFMIMPLGIRGYSRTASKKSL